MHKSLHVLFTAAWFPNRMIKGEGVFIEKHAKVIALHHKVSVLFVKADPAVTCGYEIEIERDKNLKIYRIYVPKIKSNIPFFSGIIRFIHYLNGSFAGYRKIVNENGKPDISHVNVLTRAGLIPFFLKRFGSIPYIITEHWSRYSRKEYPSGLLHKYISEKIVQEASVIAPVSKNLQQALIDKNLKNNNFCLVNNVVDTDIFYCKDYNKNISENKIIFSHVSWMRDDAKNISGIIDVINQLSHIKSNFQLNLIGEGIDKEMLEEKVKSLCLEQFISFQGPKSGDDLANALRSSNFLILFSNFESQPVCVLEALSCGIPVISTDVGILSEMLGHDRGILIKPKDNEALLKALIEMMDSYKNYNPHKLHQYINDNYSPSVIFDKFNDLYIKSIENIK